MSKPFVRYFTAALVIGYCWVVLLWVSLRQLAGFSIQDLFLDSKLTALLLLSGVPWIVPILLLRKWIVAARGVANVLLGSLLPFLAAAVVSGINGAFLAACGDRLAAYSAMLTPFVVLYCFFFAVIPAGILSQYLLRRAGHEMREPIDARSPGVGIVIVTAVILSAQVVAGIYCFGWWRACRKVSSASSEITSPEVARDLAYRALRIPFAYDPHDAFLILGANGDSDSVPYLLRGLRWQLDTGDDGMICTKSHCLDALMRITGHEAGQNYSDWQTWWTSVGRKMTKESYPTETERFVNFDLRFSSRWEWVAIQPAVRRSQATPVLIRALSDKRNSVRAGSACCLLRHGTEAKEALPPLTELLRDGDPTVRIWAAWAIGRIDPKNGDAVSMLHDELNDDNWTILQIDESATDSARVRQAALQDAKSDRLVTAAVALADISPTDDRVASLLARALTRPLHSHRYPRWRRWMLNRVSKAIERVTFNSDEEIIALRDLSTNGCGHAEVREAASGALKKATSLQVGRVMPAQ